MFRKKTTSTTVETIAVTSKTRRRRFQRLRCGSEKICRLMLPKAYRIQAGDGTASGSRTSALYDARIVGRLKPALLILLALGLGAGLRFYFFLHWSQINGDSMVYGDIAKNWLQHGIYGPHGRRWWRCFHPSHAHKASRLSALPRRLFCALRDGALQTLSCFYKSPSTSAPASSSLLFVLQICSRRARVGSRSISPRSVPSRRTIRLPLLRKRSHSSSSLVAMMGLLRIVTRGDGRRDHPMRRVVELHHPASSRWRFAADRVLSCSPLVWPQVRARLSCHRSQTRVAACMHQWPSLVASLCCLDVSQLADLSPGSATRAALRDRSW